jgi:HK97 gp10 family phage protein
MIQKIPGEADKLVKAGATAIQGKAATLAPVDTGALKSSLHTEKHGELTYWAADGVEYGIYQELGTSRMAAHPFMVPAAEWVRPQYVESFRKLLRIR